ncbi:MAG TPA: hypothetical protein VM677_19490 [Actinokineospora sp.]|nr:hypothetical protein [Actinokineospora sp.]
MALLSLLNSIKRRTAVDRDAVRRLAAACHGYSAPSGRDRTLPTLAV